MHCSTERASTSACILALSRYFNPVGSEHLVHDMARSFIASGVRPHKHAFESPSTLRIDIVRASSV